MSGRTDEIDRIYWEASQRTTDGDRNAYLDTACGDNRNLRERVEKLLNAQPKAERFLERPFGSDIAPTIDVAPIAIQEEPGMKIGRYKLVHELGHGGMGVVYMAVQKEPVKRKVALKIIKPGMDTKEVVSRFNAERQALAMMDHQCIAKVLDGGSTDSGRPFFVMELVSGTPITEYCDECRYTTRQRLELFVKVCHAVQHAHLKGVIHRDIKPSNILVTTYDCVAVPKVIDFGIAKAVHQSLTDGSVYTQISQMVGTPLYMSPEQAQRTGQDVDTRTDVYSLGVLLYELLTGATPFDKSRFQESGLDEVKRIIREEEPPKPSTRLSTLGETDLALDTLAETHHTDLRTLTHELSGELDWIVMKALEKDRNRRYESASDFAKDVQRYLDDEPVEACPPSTTYRLKKFARRNKGLLTTATLLAATMLVATGVSLAFAVQANAEKDKALAAQGLADERLEQSRVDFDRALKALDTVVEELSSAEFAQIPGVEKTRTEVLGRMLTLYEAIAEEHDNDPYARQQQALAYGRVADILGLMGQPGEAEKAVNQGISIIEELRAASPDDKDYESRLADLLFRRLHLPTRPREARLEDAQRALALREDLVQPGRDEHIGAVGLLHLKVADLLPEGSPHVDEHIANSIRIPEEHGLTPHWAPYIRTAQRAEKKGDFAEAEKNYRLGIEGCRRTADGGNRIARGLLCWCCGDFAKLLNSMGRPDEAQAFYRESIEVAQQLYREYGKLAVYEEILRNSVLGYVQDAKTKQQKDEAAKLFGELIVEFPEALDLHRLRAESFSGLDDAEAKLTAAMQEYPRQAVYYFQRAKLYQQQHDYDKALADYKLAEEADKNYFRVYEERGSLHMSQERYEEALADLNKALELEPFRSWTYKRRGATHFKLGHFVEALADLNTAIELNHEDLSALWWIPLSQVATCPDEAFRDGLLKLADKAIELNHKAARAYAVRGRILAALGQEEKALVDLKTAFDGLPKDESGELGLSQTCDELSNLCGELEYRKETLPYLARMTELRPKDLTVWYRCALAQLGASQADAYKATCRDMVNGFQHVASPAEGYWIAWTCLLGPEAVDDYASVVRLAEAAVEADPDSEVFLNTLGAILYRAGRFEEAVERLDKADELMKKPDASAQIAPAYGWYFLAMAHQQLGHQDEAKQWLDKANTWTEKVLREHAEGTTALPWNRRLTLKLLRDEAEQTIASTEDASEP